jgi:hypothetical protein
MNDPEVCQCESCREEWMEKRHDDHDEDCDCEECCD